MVRKAVAVIRGDTELRGTVTFVQREASAPVDISWEIYHHTPNAERGMHIHAFGDTTNGCTSAGPHFNPFDKEHGAPEDSNRHVGDLGNIKIDSNGQSKGTMRDVQVTLFGEHSVVGRSVVVHAGTDDLGRGGNAESKKTGNAGARPACGVIGLTDPPKGDRADL